MQGVLNLLFVISLTSTAASNELWVAVENRLESTAQSTDSISIPTVKHIIGLSATAHSDSGLPQVFATTLDPQGPAVCRVGREGQVLLARGPSTATYFEDIAHDSEHSILYLTSKSSHSISRMAAREGAEIEVFIHTGDKNPSGIAIDSCSGRIYWTNSNRKRPTIETFLPSSSNHSMTLLSSGLARPRAVTVDTSARRLYWSDIHQGKYRIESSRLDGSDRSLLVQGDAQDPFSLVTDGDFVYWSDWTSHTVWRFHKSWQSSRRPELVQSFPRSRPHGIAFISASQPTCTASKHDLNFDSISITKSQVPVTQVSMTEVSVTKAPATQVSLKEGPFTEGSVKEAPGTSISVTAVPATEGSATDIPVSKTRDQEDLCHNFCLADGLCQLDSGGPVCECSEGRTGLRCEEDSCLHYCLGEASCVVIEDVPECLCSPGFQGDRCQINVTDSAVLTLTPIFGSMNLQIIVFSLAVATGILIVIVIGLSVTVFRMRKRPRVVRKRFISVARSEKEGKGSSQCGLPVEDGITLDIENCCNMTLCDTPCFEPPTRGPRKTSSRSKAGVCQDKRGLLDAEEREEEGDNSLDF